jgi:hypothetical protein
MQFGRRIGIDRSTIEPALGRLQIGTAQGRALGASLIVPAARELGEPRMLAHPGKIGTQRRVEGGESRHAIVCAAAKHPVQSTQGHGSVRIRDAPRHDRDHSLAEPGALFELPGADRGADRIRADHVDDRVGRADQSRQPLLPGLARCDVGLVEKGIEATLLERRDQHLRKVDVLARIGDEDLGMSALGGDPCRHGNCRRHLLVHEFAPHRAAPTAANAACSQPLLQARFRRQRREPPRRASNQ